MCSAAVRSDCKELVKLLLLQGAKVNQEVTHGRHPLHEAARLGRAAIVTLLLEAGAHPDPRSHYGLTPLALAAQGGHHEVVEALLNKGEILPAWALLTFNFTHAVITFYRRSPIVLLPSFWDDKSHSFFFVDWTGCDL